MTEIEPRLLRAVDRPESEVGSCEWDRDHNTDLLTVSDHGMTVEWGLRKPTYTGKYYPPAWVPAITRLVLHSGSFRWDFVVEEMANAQIGIGFMLLWNIGPDWGFYGYLGASSTAWSYGPSTGDVVTTTASIEGGLPRFADRRTGRVSVELDLPRQGVGRGRFVVDDTASSWIRLSDGAVVLPAACLLRETQRVTLAQFERR